jgi:glycerol-3-phosphate dehydrogenase (NAD(P)+)
MKAVSIAVIGNGRWARALSVRLKRNQRQTKGRIRRAMLYQPPPDLPRLATFAEPSEIVVRVPTAIPKKAGSGNDETLQMTADALMFAAGEVYAESIDIDDLRDADLIVMAVPASKVKPLLRTIADVLRPEQAIAHAIGSFAPIEGAGRHNMLPVSELIRRETPVAHIGAIAGPALAEDLEEEIPVAMICGSLSPEVPAMLYQAFHGPLVRVYSSSDLVGVEVSRALVGVYAFAVGVADAMELGPAVRSLLIARGTAEISRLAATLGGQERTPLGPAGLGELIVATERRGAPDFQLGKLIGKGASLGDAARQIDRACDALNMIREGQAHAQRTRLTLPIVSALYRWVGGRHDLRASINDLIEKDLFAP